MGGGAEEKDRAYGVMEAEYGVYYVYVFDFDAESGRYVYSGIPGDVVDAETVLKAVVEGRKCFGLGRAIFRHSFSREDIENARGIRRTET